MYKPYLEDGKTVFSSPHKVYGPETNDLLLQLRKRGIDKLILAGMSANLCVEAHLRALSEQDFAVAEVKDATAAAQIREGDGYAAAVTLPLFGRRRLDRLRGQDEDRRIEDCQVTPVGVATRVVAPRGTASLVTWNLRIQRCCHALARRFGACLPGTSTRPRSLTLCSRTGR